MGFRGILHLIFLSHVCLALFVRSSPLTSQDEKQKRLIKTAEDQEPQWLNESQIWDLVKHEISFMDVTNHNFPPHGSQNGFRRPQSLQYEEFVRESFKHLNIGRVEQFIQTFSRYETRWYTSPTGIESQKWLLNQVEETLLNFSGHVTVDEFSHSWPEQKTVTVRFHGSENTTMANEIVILGAHQDSVSYDSVQAPGADDNASGSAVLLETLRCLVAMGFSPKRTVEFQWYAAEEVGLRGSGEVAQSYHENGLNVISMVNYDVAGYDHEGRREIRLVTDYIDPELTAYLGSIIDAYLDYPWSHYRCGYACSDHASFTEYGFPAARPAEFVYTPYMHTGEDVIGTLGFDQIMEFTKLAIGYVVEMGEPSLV